MKFIKAIFWGSMLLVVFLLVSAAIMMVPWLFAKGFGVDPVYVCLGMIAAAYFLVMGFSLGPSIETWLSQKLKNWRAKGS